jgi:L-threonylcarbamoyladenylate synthase
MLRIRTDAPGAYDDAAQQLRRARLVAFPTETVYGLGADAEHDDAVARIFAVKGRPVFNPLIVHVPDIATAERYGHMTPLATRLAASFWPGPLTLVVPRAEASPVSLLASAGLDTVALRCPSHPEAQALLSVFGRGIAAPSANRSGRLSPTEAWHVAEEYADAALTPDVLLEGAACTVGLESTILDVTGDEAILLRPGSLTLEMLQHVVAVREAQGGAIRAPGMLLSHYAPRATLRLNALDVQPEEALLAFGPTPPSGAIYQRNLSASGDLVEAAARLFADLRALDKVAHTIAVMPIPEEGIGRAINDRLRRAAAPRDVREPDA